MGKNNVMTFRGGIRSNCRWKLWDGMIRTLLDLRQEVRQVSGEIGEFLGPGRKLAQTVRN